MSVRKIATREALESDRIERSIRRDTKKVSQAWYTETLTNTVSAMVYNVLTLFALVGLVLGKINGLTIGLVIIPGKSNTNMVNALIVAIIILVLVLGEMAQFMVKTMWVLCGILVTVLLEIFHTINEVFRIDLIMVTSDQTRCQMVDQNKVYMAAMSRKTLNMKLLRQQTATKRDTLIVKQNEINLKCISETSVIIEDEDKPETNVRILTDMIQTNVRSIEELTAVNDTNMRIVDLDSFVYSPNTNQNVSCRDDKLAKWRRQRFFTDEATTITLTQSNNQAEDLTENSSNTRNDDLVIPVSSPYVPPAVFSRVDKMAKWRPWRYFFARKPTVKKSLIRHNKPTQYRYHWRGPNTGPRDQNFMSSRTPNVWFNTHVPRTIFPPAPRPSFGQFWNGYRDYGVSSSPRIGHFRQGYWPYGTYTVPPMFHQ